MPAEYQFLDYLFTLGWWWTMFTVCVASIALIIFVLHELWTIPEPGPRKDD